MTTSTGETALRQRSRGSDRFIRAGEQCAHCGATTPLGGTCADCGGRICTRSARLREMALNGQIGPHWACPNTREAAGAATDEAKPLRQTA